MPRSVDTISLIKPAHQTQLRQSVPYAFVHEHLFHNAQEWNERFRAILRNEGVQHDARSYNWSEVNVIEELPTDMVVYFVDVLDFSIAPEIGKVLVDGRTHFILVLSLDKIPNAAEQLHFTMKAKLVGSLALVTRDLQEDEGNTTKPLLHLHEMPKITNSDLRGLFRSLIQRKVEMEQQWN